MSLTAYDFDGVLTAGFPLNETPLIITGRSFRRFEETLQDLKDLGIDDAQLYMCPVPLEQEGIHASAAWKSQLINSMSLERFYEDDVRIATLLQRACPCCRIVLFRVM